MAAAIGSGLPVNEPVGSMITPPELAADIMDKGIMVSGGGAFLKGLNKLIFSELHIPANISEDPLECVVLGAGKCLDMIDKI